MGLKIVLLDRALLSFYRMSIVTILRSFLQLMIWLEFAVIILTGCFDPKSTLCVTHLLWYHIISSRFMRHPPATAQRHKMHN